VQPNTPRKPKPKKKKKNLTIRDHMKVSKLTENAKCNSEKVGKT